MSLIVQKYGGTSMGSPERIREVARRIQRFAREGHQLVVVPSAMAGETSRLLGLARELNPEASPRELDVIASTGEQVSIGLLSLALQRLGVEARSYTGWQVPVLTDDAYTKARILSIEDQRMRSDLAPRAKAAASSGSGWVRVSRCASSSRPPGRSTLIAAPQW